MVPLRVAHVEEWKNGDRFEPRRQRLLLCRLGGERVAVTEHGADDLRVLGVVVEGGPDFLHEPWHERFVDFALWPHQFQQGLFGDRRRAALDQNLEEPECFPRQVRGFPSAPKLVSLGVEYPAAEVNVQWLRAQ